MQLSPSELDQCGCPPKSCIMRLSATRTLRIVAGVLRLRPTKRGTPSVTTAPTAGTSPFRIALKASVFEPPAQASIMMTSASRPGARRRLNVLGRARYQRSDAFAHKARGRLSLRQQRNHARVIQLDGHVARSLSVLHAGADLYNRRCDRTRRSYLGLLYRSELPPHGHS